MSPVATREVPSNVTAELIQLVGGEKKAQQELVLSLLRRGQISTGKAAELLGISIWEMLDLMHEAGIPATSGGPGSSEEIEASLRRIGKLP